MMRVLSMMVRMAVMLMLVVRGGWGNQALLRGKVLSLMIKVIAMMMRMVVMLMLVVRGNVGNRGLHRGRLCR